MTLTAKKLKNFEKKFGPVPKVVSRLIRPSFVASPGKTLVWGDWSSIEARMLPWLAGDAGEPNLNIFRANDKDPGAPDIYKIEAAGIYDKEPEEIDKGEERQVGKVAILALGFGGGENALDAMATNYGIVIERKMRHFIVDRWRTNNQWAVDFWSDLNDAFFRAWDNPGQVFEAGRVAYIFLEDYIFGSMMCFLPDGRPLVYPDLRREKIKYEDDVTGDLVTEWKVRYQKGYERGSIWHGILAENITQGAAASLLRALLQRLRHEPLLSVVGHTHDEAVVEVVESAAEIAARALKVQMERNPGWAPGLPLVAETTTNWYYSKAVG